MGWFSKTQPAQNDAELPRAPTAEDFTNGAVERAIFVETIQHPATIFPAAVSAVSVFYMMLIDANPTALAVALVGGVVAVGAWIVNYFFRGEKLAEEHVAKLKALQEECGRRELMALRDECSRAGFTNGEELFDKLCVAHEKLSVFLTEKVKTRQNLNAERFIILTNDAFQKGLSLLRQAAQVHQAIRSIDSEGLEKEHGRLERQLKKASEEEAELCRAKLESCAKLLKVYEARKKTLSELTVECEKQKCALEVALLELTDMLSGNGPNVTTKQDAVSSELERAVNAARAVEERLRKFDAEGVESADRLSL